MAQIQVKIRILFIMIIIYLSVFSFFNLLPGNRVIADNIKCDSAKGQQGINSIAKPPIVVWHFHLVRDDIKVLDIVLKSGLVNQISIGGSLNRRDFDYRNKKVYDAVAIIKKYGAKVEWTRNLWPLYNIGNVTASDFFDPNYYVGEIKALKAEANDLGADYTGLGLEPHGNPPMLQYMKPKGKNPITKEQLEQLRLAVKDAVKIIDKVDFIDSGTMDRNHPYSILSELGENKVSYDTFWFDMKRIKSIKYHYDIFGVYLNNVKYDELGTKYPYFSVSEIFENSYLWSDKKGIFLYPRENKALELAKELLAYSKSLPAKTAP